MVISKFNLKYISIGFINTIIGYWVSIIIFYIFYEKLGIIGVGLMANILNISITYINYKFFLFKTKGNFLREYFKSFINYGLAGLLSTFLLWFFFDVINLNIYLSNILIIPITFMFSYMGNKFFVFK